MQTLVMEGRTLNVDASFKDDGMPPVYAMVGNQRTLLNAGQAGHPDVFTFEGQYFFANGELCTKPEQIDWIAEPYRTEALQFVARMAKKLQKDRKGQPIPQHVKIPRLRVQVPDQPGSPILGGKKVRADTRDLHPEHAALMPQAGVDR